MKRVIAVANQKGGVGKTTTAVNLAASLTATKRRVLLIDLDPQGNATMGCGIDKHSQARTSCDVLLGDCAAMEALVPVEYGGFMLMPANQDLTAAEVRLLGMITGREFKLRNALKPLREQFRRDPDRLSAVAQHADAECAGGGGFGHGPDAMRVLRARRLELAWCRPSSRSEAASTRIWKSKDCCAPCSTRAITCRTKSPRS